MVPFEWLEVGVEGKGVFCPLIVVMNVRGTVCCAWNEDVGEDGEDGLEEGSAGLS